MNATETFAARLRCTQDWATYCDAAFFGETREYARLSQDDLNFYAHGVDDEAASGITSNYKVLPKYAWSLT